MNVNIIAHLYKFMNKSTGNFFLKKKFTPQTPSNKKSNSFTRGQTSASSQNMNFKTQQPSKHMNSPQINNGNTSTSAIREYFSTSKPRTSQSGRYKRRYKSIQREQVYSSNNCRSAMQMSFCHQRKNRKNTLKESEQKSDPKNTLKIILFSLEVQFTQHFKQCNYSKASDVLVKILNYSIDYNMKDLFFKSLKRLSEFYLKCSELNAALFYYNQIRQSAILLKQYSILIESLIGIAVCCRKSQMLDQALIILKKTVQLSWYFEKQQLQLTIYDEMGKIYYLKGDLELAQSYHNRYASAVVEQFDSPQRFLSDQRVKKILSQYNTYDEMCVLFLIHLKIPIFKTSQLPLLESQTGVPLRDQLSISSKYFLNWEDIRVMIQKILQENFFSDQTQSLDLIVKPKQSAFLPKKKTHDFIDFQLKQHLKKIGMNAQIKQKVNMENIPKKQSLDEKVKRKLNEPKMDPNWHQKMIKQIKRDRKNKLFKIQNIIRVRGKNKRSKPQNQEMRKLFEQFFQEKKMSQNVLSSP